ncbi:phosphoglycerate mutase [Ignicoccus islandicus DSM 13165]|uniref:2,3-bisphosphoglycerate-independent phosphoglycerate mutase n=2 Tax=Ignicoccus islandicus TaxID=54259 RepID=A0A0U3EC29_9CREN|nr:2,3-bisphosphoglycerate-independent phosphoglycerate mutase [Ignicoccus islandicus]ALU12019.1 phosphoglycerate mutase [Ignicoccus islandicus DSM 13165]
MVLIVGDGMGDRLVPSLNYKTPLQEASTPNLDEMARRGQTGLINVIAPGIPPGSDTAHISLFGLDPFLWYEGRGPFEAMGVGASLTKGDVALRGNFATVKEEGGKLIVVDRRAGRKVDEASELVEVLNEKLNEVDGVKVEFYHATEHRLAVVLRGEGLSDKVSDTDPHEVGKPVLESRPLEDTPEAKKTAEVLTKITFKSYEVLKDHPANKRRIEKGLPPANIVLLRGAGMLRKPLPTLQERIGVKAAAVGATALVLGVAKAVGMDLYTPPGATGGVDTDYKSKARKAVELLKDYDMVFVHLKGTDAASHDGLVEEKVRMIEALDYIAGYIMDYYDGEAVFVVTPDHATPVTVKEHTGDPVPSLLYAPTAIPDDTKEYNEISVAKGKLSGIRGMDLFNLMVNYANRAKKFGA